MNLTLISSAVALAIGLSTGFGAAWKLQASNITELENTYATSTMDAQRAAFAQSERRAETVIAAQSKAATRVAANRVAAGGAAAAGNWLRESSASAASAAKESLAACTASVTRYDLVLGAVVSEAQRLGEAADAWQSDAVMLYEAWPK